MTEPFLITDYYGQDAAVHFVGCGGAGTAPLMRIFQEKGFRVSGSDLEENSLTDRLRALHVPIFIGPHDASHLPECSKLLLVHTSAALETNPEIMEARKRGAVILRRGQALAEIAKLFSRVVSVSGSHGKTSITAMLAFVLKECGEEPGYLIGGKLNDGTEPGAAGRGTFFITEGDESDGTNALLHSELAIVNNLEDDHVWSLGGIEVLKENFRKFATYSRRVIYGEGKYTDDLFSFLPHAVGLHTLPAPRFSAAFCSSHGNFQIINSIMAAQALAMLGFPFEKTVPILERFEGVDRRMSIRYDSPALRLIEDYAHHPTELMASLSALKKTNPQRRLVVIFQPHRYARLERYFSDFAEILKNADRSFIIPVFAAWTAGGKYNSDDLAAAIGTSSSALHGTWREQADTIRKTLQNGDTVAIIGAGDLNQIIPFLTPGTSESGK